MNKKKAKIMRNVGYVLLLTIILLCIPFTVPRLMGYNVYNIETNSMKPDYPAGTLIYVEEMDVSSIKKGDVITFRLGTDTDKVMTHRVDNIDKDNKCFITKGDANKDLDKDTVSYDRLIGVPVHSFPILGRLTWLFSTVAGMIVMGIVLAVILVLWIVSDVTLARIRRAKKEEIARKRANGEEIPEKHLKNKKKFDIKVALPLILGIALMVYAGGSLIRIYLNYDNSNSLYASLADDYTQKSSKTSAKIEWYDRLSIDFDGLKKQNEEVVAWIYFENEDISYPILYSGDDSKYLRTALDKSEAIAGSIFLEGKNNTNFEDSHSLIYGHNMRNLSMFGKLKFYKKEGYYPQHQYFQIITPTAKYRYQIFAYEDVSENSFIYSVPYEANDEFQDFINKIVSNSYINSGVQATKNDKIITLSTCSTEKHRFAVHAKRVDTKEISKSKNKKD